MLTTSNAVEEIIRDNPFLSDNFIQGLVNYSALARKIRPNIEKKLQKRVSVAAIIMSLKRMNKKKFNRHPLNEFINDNPGLIVRSNLTEFSFENSNSLHEKHKILLQNVDYDSKYFLTITQGVFETSIISSYELKDKISKLFQNERIVSQMNNLSSITIRFSKEVVLIPGIFYFILKPLAWEGINIIEVVSASSEFTILLDNQELSKAFFVLKNLFQKKV